MKSSLEMEVGSDLALLGGKPTVTREQKDMFTWPIVTEEHEQAVLKVLRTGKMSGTEVTREFEKGFAQWHGSTYALACPNGTAAILEAMFAVGIKAGDEVVCPAMTYWASVVQLYSLGATPVFADIQPETLNIDPQDIERKITPRTKAIVVVHYAGRPVDMDAVMSIANEYNLKVIEDCSHAHGSLYKGKIVGTFGDAGAFSLMTGKAFAIGEGGIFITNDRRIYERGILWGHYIRHNEIELPDLKEYAGLPCGGVKNRMHQLTAAFGVVQLRHYPDQMREIDRAMNYFCDLLEDMPGISPMRPPKDSGCTMGGWYYPHFRYHSDQLSGLSLKRFSKAVKAEGSICNPGCNKPLHLHPLFTSMDIYGHGRPTRLSQVRDVNAFPSLPESLPIAERINQCVFEIPWFKHFRRDIIEEHARAYKKVLRGYKELLVDDLEDDRDIGGYSSFFKSSNNSK